jgi:CO dehydrogenase/acetyl-CoA synthase gamma subunit (corrinoid Fe-S protein)
MTKGFPVAFVSVQAMALQIGQPIASCMRESFLASLHVSLYTELVIFTWIVSYFVLTRRLFLSFVC